MLVLEPLDSESHFDVNFYVGFGRPWIQMVIPMRISMLVL
jgi:hypothetical protein